MSEQLTVYEAEITNVKPSGMNYTLQTTDGASMKLMRDVDFGVIPGTNKPSLFKAGAEKVCAMFGLLQHYTIETKIEDFEHDAPFCFYTVKCELVKIAQNGLQYTFATGLGSANTREKGVGRASCYDAANSCLKKASKRALVGAALSVGALSGLFYADLEDEKFVDSNYSALAQTQNPEAPLTNQQMKRIYALAGSIGLNAQEAKLRIKDSGFASMKDIKQKDYDNVCALFEQKGEE